MTALDQDGAPGLTAGRTALSRLVRDPDRFRVEHWGVAPLLTPSEELPSGFDDLFSDAAVDELVTTRGLRTPFLRVAKDGATLPQSAFTSGGGVGAGIADQVDDTRLTALFADGATIVLQALHRTWPPIVAFTQSLCAELGHPVQVNAYVTPPQSQGFDDHYDVHDVFVLQVAGEKRWRIHAPVHEAPLRDQPWTSRRSAVEARAAEEPVIDAVLRPGDVLYLPRGTLHAATALGDVSTHLTFGVHTWNRHHLAEDLAAEALRRLADDPEVRASLPLGVDVADPTELAAHVVLVRDRLVAAVLGVPVDQLAGLLGRRSRLSGRAGAVGPLAQLEASRRLEPSDRVRLRDHVAAVLDGTVLRSRAGVIDVAAIDAAVLRDVVAGHDVAVGSIGLDEARRLLAAGVLVPA